MGTEEKNIENQILNFLKLRGIFCFKNQSVGIFDPRKKIYRKNHNPHHIKGTSDIIGILPNGVFLAIEVKRNNPKTYASKEQKEFIQNINDRFGVAFVARSIQDVEEHLKDFLK